MPTTAALRPTLLIEIPTDPLPPAPVVKPSRLHLLVVKICRVILFPFRMIAAFFQWCFKCCWRKPAGLTEQERDWVTDWNRRYYNPEPWTEESEPPLIIPQTDALSTYLQGPQYRKCNSFQSAKDEAPEVAETRKQAQQMAVSVAQPMVEIFFEELVKPKLDRAATFAKANEGKLEADLNMVIRWIGISTEYTMKALKEFERVANQDNKENNQQSSKFVVFPLLIKSLLEVKDANDTFLNDTEICDRILAWNPKDSKKPKKERVIEILSNLREIANSVTEKAQKEGGEQLGKDLRYFYNTARRNTLNKEEEYKAYEAIFGFLTAHKITPLTDSIHKLLVEELPSIIQNMMQNNAEIIAKQLANRWISLLKKIPFPESFDDTVELLGHHLTALNKAEEIASSNLILAKKLAADPNQKLELDDPLFGAVEEIRARGLANIDKVKQKLFEVAFAEQPGSHDRLKKSIKHLGIVNTLLRQPIPSDLSIKTLEKINKIIDRLWRIRTSVDAYHERQEKLKSVKELLQRLRAEKIDKAEKTITHLEDAYHHLEAWEDLSTQIQKDLNTDLFFSKFAEGILRLLLPPLRKVHGNQSGTDEKSDVFAAFHRGTLDGVTGLLLDLKIPKEFEELVKKVQGLGKNMMPETLNFVLDYATHLPLLIDRVVVNIAKPFIVYNLKEGLQRLFKLVTNPLEINKLMADAALPAVQQLMVRLFAQQSVVHDPKALSELLHKLLEAHRTKTDEEAFKTTRDQLIEGMIAAIYKQTSNYCIQFSMQNVDRKSFDDSIQPWIEEIERLFVDTQKVNREIFSKLSKTQEVFAYFLKGDFRQYGDKERSKYEKLLLSVIDLSGFDSSMSKGKIETYKKDIASSILDSIRPLRRDFNETTRLIAFVVQNNFSDKETLRRLFSFSKYQDERTPQEVQAKLNDQIAKMAHLTHDITVRIVKEKMTGVLGFFGGLFLETGVSWAVGRKGFERLISTSITQFTRQESITNLFCHGRFFIMKIMHDAAQKINDESTSLLNASRFTRVETA